MDDYERAAIAAEGYDPDDPHLIAALAHITYTLRTHHHLHDRYPWRHHTTTTDDHESRQTEN